MEKLDDWWHGDTSHSDNNSNRSNVMGVLQEFLEERVFNDETKDKLVKALNDAVDIPFISEKTEGKIIDSMISVVFEIFKKVLLGSK